MLLRMKKDVNSSSVIRGNYLWSLKQSSLLRNSPLAPAGKKAIIKFEASLRAGVIDKKSSVRPVDFVLISF